MHLVIFSLDLRLYEQFFYKLIELFFVYFSSHIDQTKNDTGFKHHLILSCFGINICFCFRKNLHNHLKIYFRTNIRFFLHTRDVCNDLIPLIVNLLIIIFPIHTESLSFSLALQVSHQFLILQLRHKPSIELMNDSRVHSQS